VGAFLMGCAVLLMVVGCAGVRSEAPQEEEQAHTEATASEEARCSQTRTYKEKGWGSYTTNDVPGCPKGGLLSGTDKGDALDGKEGDDEIRGLSGVDDVFGGGGNDVIYGGDGRDWLVGGAGEDVLYGGKGYDELLGFDPEPESPVRDELYCGPGKDPYGADKLDYVDSSCELEMPPGG
jgi:hypothetical protein